MRDQLLDLVEHTYDLGCIDTIKVVGTDKDTAVSALAENHSVVIEANFSTPIAEFIGTFGMPNLNKLKILLNLPEYRENAKVTVTQRNSGEPDGINFENQTGDFCNQYRFMSSQIINEQLKTAKFKGTNWDVEFEPTVASIQRLRMQAQANAEEPLFQVRVEKRDLKFYFGDHSTHGGNFVFQSDVTGVLKHSWAWPVSIFQSILNLTGDKQVKFSDAGAAEIVVNSGMAVYRYILPAQKK
jgi:hypothetical protein